MNAEVIGHLKNIDATLGQIAESMRAMVFVEESRSYTKREAARILGCSVRTVERRIHDGRLAAVQRDAQVRISGQSLKEIVEIATERTETRVVHI